MTMTINDNKNVIIIHTYRTFSMRHTLGIFTSLILTSTVLSPQFYKPGNKDKKCWMLMELVLFARDTVLV
jgi:hypothetical protein